MGSSKFALPLLLVVCILAVTQSTPVKQEESPLILSDVASEGNVGANNRVKRQLGLLGSLLLGGGYGYNPGYYGMFFYKRSNFVKRLNKNVILYRSQRLPRSS